MEEGERGQLWEKEGGMEQKTRKKWRVVERRSASRVHKSGLNCRNGWKVD